MATAAELRDSAIERYSRGAILFHWTIAALIALNLFLGYFHEDFGRDARGWMMFFHRSIGITVLVLSLGRLAWRLGHKPPPFDPVLKRWEAGLAHATHWIFYALMIVLPLSGWLIPSTSGRAFSFFGLFEIGALPVAESEDAHEQAEDAHALLGYAMLGLIALHVAGAAKHHLQGHRHLIRRMAPGRTRSR